MGVPKEAIEERKAKGIDLFDEVWGGEYRAVPAPSFEHQDVVTRLAAVLSPHALGRGLGDLVVAPNVARPGAWPTDFRIPDLVFVSKARRSRVRGEYIEGGPDLVIEVRSPDDGTYAKLPFYEAVGTGEVLVVDRDTKRVELFRLRKGRLRAEAPDEEGWLRSQRLRFAIRSVRSRRRAAVELLCEGASEPARIP